MADQEGSGDVDGAGGFFRDADGDLTTAGRSISASVAATVSVLQGGDLLDIASAGAAFVPPPYGQVLQLGIAFLQGRKKDREERAKRLEQIKELLGAQRRTSLGTVASLAYGQCRVPGIVVHSEVNKALSAGVAGGMPVVRPAAGVATRGQVATNGKAVGAMSETRGNYLLANEPHVVMAQYALGVGDIEGIRDVLVNGESINFAGSSSDRKYDGVFTCQFDTAGSASSLATAFCGLGGADGGTRADNAIKGTGSRKRSASSVGENLSKGTCFFNLLRDGKVRYTSEPAVEFLVKGRKVRTVESSNLLSSSRTYTANLVYVLLDYVLDTVIGLGIPEAEIDLASVRVAASRNPVVLGAGADASIGGQTIPKETPVSGTPSGSYRSEWVGKWLIENGYAYTSGDPDTDTNGDRSGAQQREYQHEFDGALESVDTAEGALRSLMSPCPWLIVARGDDGRIYFDMPDTVTPEATQSLSTFRRYFGESTARRALTDTDFLSPLQVTYPPSDSITTRAKVSFEGINKDFGFQGAVFPKRGSNGEQVLRNRYGDARAYEKSMSIKGIMDKAHAYSYGGNVVSLSLRNTYSFALARIDAVYRAGDIVRLQSSTQGEDAYARILTRQPRNKMVTNYTAIEFDRDDFELSTPAGAGLVAPASLSATQEDSNPVAFSWPASDPSSPLALLHVVEGTTASEWASGQTYADNALVRRGDFLYRATSAHDSTASGAAGPPGAEDSRNWEDANDEWELVQAVPIPGPRKFSAVVAAGTWTFRIRVEGVSGASPHTYSAPLDVEAAAGASAPNTALATLYQRTDSDVQPVVNFDVDDPENTSGEDRATFRFSTHSFDNPESELGGWAKTLKGAGRTGKYLWIAQAPASARGDTVDLSENDFEVSLMAVGGDDGMGVDVVHRLATLAELAAWRADKAGWSGLPLFDFPYEQPRAPWTDDPEDATDQRPVHMIALRAVPATPPVGDIPTREKGYGQWRVWVESVKPVEGQNVPAFRQQYREINVVSEGSSVDGATSFSPNPSSVELVLVYPAGTRIPVTVTGTVSSNSVNVVLSDTENFELVDE